jgi:putative ABC transport system permease protein
MRADLKFALRGFRNNPGFVAVAVIVLALGVGANTAMFSVLDAVLLRTLPFRDPDRMVMLWERNPAMGDFLAERMPTCLTNLLQWKTLARSFDSITAFEVVSLNLTGTGKPEVVEAARAAADFGDLFGVRAALGRMYAAGEDHVVVISHKLATTRFGGAAKALGQTMELNQGAYTVIGVWPASFRLPAMWEGFDQRDPAVWIPLDMRPAQDSKTLNARTKFVYARLRAGATLDQARVEMTAIGTRLQRDFPDVNKGFNVNVFPLSIEDVGPSTRKYVLILEGAVTFVLLIACANVANILLARSIARRRELAMRMALGASRFRLARQMMAESLLLSVTGAAAGLLLAYWGTVGISALAPADTPHLHDIHLDRLALAFTLSAAIATGFIFGLAPALDAARRNVNEALNQGGRSGSSGLRKHLRGVLVAGEVALALVLVVGAGLLIRTVHAMLAADPGFRRDGLLSVRLNLPDWKYPTDASTAPFCRQLLEKVSALPGVISASLTSGMPMQNLQISSYSFDGAAPPGAGPQPTASVRRVSEQYFRTMVIPIVRGRQFTSQETQDPKSPFILINQNMATKIWPGEDPLGKTLRLNDATRTVIGVAADVRQLGPEQSITPEIYVPAMLFHEVNVVLRSQQAPSALVAPISRLVRELDPDQPVQDSKTMNEVTAEWIAERRFVMTLLGAFAALALTLAAVGLYGVLAYSVSRRTREIGIRMALGANPRNVLKLVVGEGLMLASIGIVAGLAGALALTRLLEGLIFGVRSTDPWTMVIGVVVLLAAAAAASAIPARRASRVEPLEALRIE